MSIKIERDNMISLHEMIFGKQEKEIYQGETLDQKPLFNFSDKKSDYADKVRFIFLGSMTKQDKRTYNKVKQAIKEMGYTEEVVLIRDNQEIIKSGVAATPALLIDGKVITYGKQMEVDEVKRLFDEHNIR